MLTDLVPLHHQSKHQEQELADDIIKLSSPRLLQESSSSTPTRTKDMLKNIQNMPPTTTTTTTMSKNTTTVPVSSSATVVASAALSSLFDKTGQLQQQHHDNYRHHSRGNNRSSSSSSLLSQHSSSAVSSTSASSIASSLDSAILLSLDDHTKHVLKVAACMASGTSTSSNSNPLLLPLLKEYYDTFIINKATNSSGGGDSRKKKNRHHQESQNSSCFNYVLHDLLVRYRLLKKRPSNSDVIDVDSNTVAASKNKSFNNSRLNGSININDDAATVMYEWSNSQIPRCIVNDFLQDKSERYMIHYRLGMIAYALSCSPSASLPSSLSSHSNAVTFNDKEVSRDCYHQATQKEVLTYIAAEQLNQVPRHILLLKEEQAHNQAQYPKQQQRRLPVVELVSLYLKASKLSISKSAFYPAVTLLRAGKDLLIAVSRRQLNGASMNHVNVQQDDSRLLETFWKNHYDLCLDLFNNLIETCYAIGEHSEAKDYAMNQIFKYAKTDTDRFRAQSCILEIVHNGKDRDAGKGARMCLEYLKQYGIDNISEKPSMLTVQATKRRLKALTKSNQLETIIRQAPILLPPPTTTFAGGSCTSGQSSSSSSSQYCISVFLGKVSNFALLDGNFSLATVASMYHVKHAQTYGVTMHTALSLSMIAVTERYKGNFDERFRRIANLPLELMERLSTSSATAASPSAGGALGSFDDSNVNNGTHGRTAAGGGSSHSHSSGICALKAQILAIVHAGIIPLTKPLQGSLDPVMEAYRYGIKAGDFEHAFSGAMNYGYIYTFVGLPLSHLESDMNSFGKESRNLGVAPTLQAQFPILRQTALNLMGLSESLTMSSSTTASNTRTSTTTTAPRRKTSMLVGDAMDQDTLLSEVEGKGQSMTFRDICTFRLMLAYIYSDLSTAESMIETLSEFPVDNPMVVRVLFRRAFTALAAFALSRRNLTNNKTSTRNSRKKYKKIANREFQYFKQAAQKGSVNACPVYALLLAERYPSKQRYDEAIRICCRSGFKNFEAIAFECCGTWLLEEQAKKKKIRNHHSHHHDDENVTYWANFYLSQAVERYLEWEAVGKAEQLRDAHHSLLSESSPSTTSTADENRSFAFVGTSIRGKKVHQENILAKTKALHLDDLAAHPALSVTN